MTQRVKMGLPEELYFAMLDVGHQTRRHKITGPLARTMINTAQNSRTPARFFVPFVSTGTPPAVD